MRNWGYLPSFALLAALASCAKPTYVSNGGTVTTKTRSDACASRFEAAAICVDLKWERRPTEDALGTFIFTFTDSLTGDLIDFTNDELPKVILWMPAMGHGSSPVIVEKVSLGIYRAKEVYFGMKGDWQIRFEKNSDQATYAISL